MKKKNGPVVVRQEAPGEFPDAPVPSLRDQAVLYGYYINKRADDSKVGNATVA